jgi:hypothetical protein
VVKQTGRRRGGVAAHKVEEMICEGGRRCGGGREGNDGVAAIDVQTGSTRWPGMNTARLNTA